MKNKKQKHGDKNGHCILEENRKCNDCGECDICDLDENKICDNCGKCLDEFNTDEKGYVKIPVDKIDMSGEGLSVEDFYKMYGLDKDDEENE